ncbi:hypothetical protein CHO01_06990 [Cellulomonas hominis]|uniref:DUF5129 domain-containing protein n=1 Tax=Cellulomonas hominis TaxID=156981 RepID=A0A511F8N9_9CELL|nr:hypothetical protein [Cellulomonas hominis]MBB5474330.1 hypothetical protein [Cellulomonas hominis]NKY06452.1 hypothetical protein [Cellulomonas hominis]NKY09453.1 hypothetical protein [Cellulomonas hominis]GEL45583.1 hypothetical protein CHO01_06990 [Cellulomonas hominis]
MLAPPDVVRAAADPGAGEWFGTWGPLVGVVVGALLAGLAQIVGASLGTRRERVAADRERRRQAYLAFTIAADAEMDAIQRRQLAYLGHGGDLASAIETRVVALNRRVDAVTAIQFCAPLPVQEAVDRVGRALTAIRDDLPTLDEFRREWRYVPRLQHDAIVTMRHDLGIPGTVRMDADVAAVGPVPDGYPPGTRGPGPAAGGRAGSRG